MPWERCFGRATDGIRQERYISVNSKSVFSYGPYSQRHIKNHRCCGKSVGLHPKATSCIHWKKWIVEYGLRLLGNQSSETAKSKMESVTLCLEVPNNGSAIDGEELCSLALKGLGCRWRAYCGNMVGSFMSFSFKKICSFILIWWHRRHSRWQIF